MRLKKGEKCPDCTPELRCQAHPLKACKECGTLGRHTCTAPIERADAMRAMICPDCDAQPAFPCVVTSGPYEGLTTSFHPARARAAGLTTSRIGLPPK